MKHITFILAVLPLITFSQLNIEWKKNLEIPAHPDYGRRYEQLTSLLISETYDGMCSASNMNGTTVFKFDENLATVQNYTLPVFTNWWSASDQDLVYKEGCSLVRTKWGSSAKENETCYTVEGYGPATSPVSCHYNNSLYYAEHNFFCRFSGNGQMMWKHQVTADLGQPALIAKGGGKIFIYGTYTSLGTNLMQYDTLGNKKWSVAPGDVYNLIADKAGNCYALTANGEGTVIKYNNEGQVVWSKTTPGQWSRGSFLKGDSLFVCGNISPGAMSDQKQSCAYTIMSASSGEILSQQVITVNENKNVLEHFSHIVSDGKNIYIGGSQSSWGVSTCFLLKLSKEGATGLNEETNDQSYTIFPNPSGSTFTISCDNVSSNTQKVTVRNNLGQIVQKKEIECKGQKSWELDLDRHPAGNYTLEILSGKEKVVKKVVVE